MELDVSIQLKSPAWKAALRTRNALIKEACSAAISATKIAKYPCVLEMAVVLADDAFIRELNSHYRGADKPTNVLSFPSEEDIEKRSARLLRGKPEFYLGDVVLALETLQREAQQQNKNFKHHLIHLLTHGTLHLLGYDHINDGDANRMEALEIKILKKQGIDNPYL